MTMRRKRRKRGKRRKALCPPRNHPRKERGKARAWAQEVGAGSAQEAVGRQRDPSLPYHLQPGAEELCLLRPFSVTDGP